MLRTPDCYSTQLHERAVKMESGAQIGKFNQSGALPPVHVSLPGLQQCILARESNYCSISVHIIVVHNNLDHNVQSRFFLASVLLLMPWFVYITKSTWTESLIQQVMHFNYRKSTSKFHEHAAT